MRSCLRPWFLCYSTLSRSRHVLSHTRRAASGWAANTWGEADRHEGWRGANWGGNVRWVGASVAEPASMAELQETVAKARRIRAIGSAHSFTPLVSAGPEREPAASLVSLRCMPRVCELDEPNKRLTVDAGATFSEVCAYLAGTSLALPNTASLPHFSVAGAVATGTHGSSGMGVDGRLLLSGLADAVAAIELVGPSGELRWVAEGDADFDAAVVSLGLLGIASRVTLKLVPTFKVRQRVYGGWPPAEAVGYAWEAGGLDGVLASLPEAMATCTSFSAFVNWSVDDVGMLILRDAIRSGDPPPPPPPTSWRGAQLRFAPVDGFLEGYGSFAATSTGPWHDKLHIWMKDAAPFGPQAAAELQLEHFVPLRHAAEALERTKLVASQWGSSLLYAEIRAVRGDGQLLSPYSCDADEGFDTIAITNGLCGSLGEKRVLAAAAVLEEALAPLRARPHWGKLSTVTPERLDELYGERLARFRRVCARVDAEAKFSNAHLDRMVLRRR